MVCAASIDARAAQFLVLLVQAAAGCDSGCNTASDAARDTKEWQQPGIECKGQTIESRQVVLPRLFRKWRALVVRSRFLYAAPYDGHTHDKHHQRCAERPRADRYRPAQADPAGLGSRIKMDFVGLYSHARWCVARSGSDASQKLGSIGRSGKSRIVRRVEIWWYTEVMNRRLASIRNDLGFV